MAGCPNLDARPSERLRIHLLITTTAPALRCRIMAVVRRANGARRLKKRISVLLKCEGDDADELVSQKAVHASVSATPISITAGGQTR